MAKDKYDFISDFLTNPKLHPAQKERAFLLAKKEIEKDSILGKELEERVRKLENEMIKSEFAENEISEKKENKGLPKYLDPSNSYKFLFNYNQNRILRYTCHDLVFSDLETINELCNTHQYNFEKHLELTLEEFTKFDKNNFAPSNLKALIRGYLTGKDFHGKELKDGWSTLKIKNNWSSRSLLEWTKLNPGIPPNLSLRQFGDKEIEGFNIEQINSVISESPIQNFTELVLHFKNLFHLKKVKKTLFDILQRNNENKGWSTLIDFHFVDTDFDKNHELLTDIDKLIQAYNKIIYLIIEQHNDVSRKPIVKVFFNIVDEKITLSILHQNGSFNKNVEDPSRIIGKTYADLINKQVNGYCNLILKLNLGKSHYVRVNLWNGQPVKTEKIDYAVGVEHILEYPKKLKSLLSDKRVAFLGYSSF